MSPRGSFSPRASRTQKGRAVNLLEMVLQLGTQPETDQPTQADIFWRTIERFQVSRVNRRLAGFFDVRRMSQSRQPMPVEQLEHFRVAGADTEQEDSVRQARREDR